VCVLEFLLLEDMSKARQRGDDAAGGGEGGDESVLTGLSGGARALLSYTWNETRVDRS
jgi:hypothetical protein